jgi:CHAD domain-containing protein
MKAWRALLKLAPAELAEEGKAVRGAVGGLRRGFGIARDTAVVAKVLSALCPDHASEDDAQDAAAVLLAEQGDAVRDELRRLSAEMARWSVSNETGDFLVRAFRRSYRLARRHGRRDPRRMDAEHLHDWRSMIVDLSYQLSFFAPADPARLGRLAKAAERLRSRLGNAIDLGMVRAHLAERPALDGLDALAQEIPRKIAKQCRKAAKLAKRLLARRPRRAGADLREAMEHRPPRRTSFG